MGNKKNRGMYKNLALVSQVGLNILIPILLGIYAGRYLDKKFNKDMIFTMVLLIIGAMSGFMNLFKLVDRQKPDNKDEEKRDD